MREKTDLEKVKSIARMLLLTPVHKTPYSPVVVQHPFTSSGAEGMRVLTFTIRRSSSVLTLRRTS